MALDPSIILRAGNYKSIDPGQLLEQRAQLQMRNAALAKSQRDEQVAMAKTVRLGEIGGMAAKGDYAGATNAALSAGDFDLADHVSKLDDRSKAQLHEKVTVAAPVFAAALAEPDAAKRTQIIGAALPTLQRYGYTPEEIARIQPTDEFLRGAVANAQTVDQVLTGQRSDRTYGLDREKFDYSKTHDAAQLATTERGNYLSAGLLPPGEGGGAVPAAGRGAATGGGGAPVAGRTQYGWTPRARNGGDNTDAAVDAKIAGMSKALGIDPTAPLTNLSPVQIAQALALSEGGKGSIADRNNNPGNLRDPKTGAYRRFPTEDAGIQAAAAQVRRNLARGQTTIQTMVEGLPVLGGGSRGGGSTGGGPQIIPGGKLDKGDGGDLTSDALDAAAITYMTTGQMPTGLGRQGVTQREILNRAASIRKAGGTTPEQMVANWQDYKTHQQGLKAFATGPEARTTRSLNVTIDHLDTLQNAAQALQNGNIGIFNRVRQSWNKATGSPIPTNFEGVRQIVSAEVAKAITGGNTALADRQDLIHSIGTANSPQQLAGYIAEVKKLMAGQLDGLSSQYKAATGRDDFTSRLSPRTRRALGVDQPRQSGTLSANVPTMTPEQARNAPKGTRFRTTDGRVMVRQ